MSCLLTKLLFTVYVYYISNVTNIICFTYPRKMYYTIKEFNKIKRLIKIIQF